MDDDAAQEDELAPLRGIMNGMALGVAFWTLVGWLIFG